MTPEERARALCPGHHGTYGPDCLCEEIAEAIRAAVEEEREACEKIAEDHIRYGSIAAMIRDAIRARNENHADS